jgi:hypothetical protein
VILLQISLFFDCGCGFGLANGNGYGPANDDGNGSGHGAGCLLFRRGEQVGFASDSGDGSQGNFLRTRPIQGDYEPLLDELRLLQFLRLNKKQNET